MQVFVELARASWKHTAGTEIIDRECNRRKQIRHKFAMNCANVKNKYKLGVCLAAFHHSAEDVMV